MQPGQREGAGGRAPTAVPAGRGVQKAQKKREWGFLLVGGTYVEFHESCYLPCEGLEGREYQRIPTLRLSGPNWVMDASHQALFTAEYYIPKSC